MTPDYKSPELEIIPLDGAGPLGDDSNELPIIPAATPADGE